MRKLTVFIDGTEKVVSFDRSIMITHDSPCIMVKTATVFWNYHNVTNDDSVQVFVSDSSAPNGVGAFKKVRVGEGYFNFNALVAALKRESNEHNVSFEVEKLSLIGKCRVKVGGSSVLDTLGPLLGFARGTVIQDDSQWHVSPNEVDMNRGLKYIEVSCDIVETESNVGIDGKRSDVIATLPIPTEQSLKGSAQRHVDIESNVSVKKGVYSSMTFRVKPNNGGAKIGAVLLELYIV